MSRRTDRVADLLRAELAEILRREVADPRARLAAVSEVVVSPDLEHARVRLSILGSDADRAASLEALRHAAGFIRRQLGRRVRLRVTPELAFELDQGAEVSQRISDLLEELHRDDQGA
jgi:ribosome-binding factor A